MEVKKPAIRSMKYDEFKNNDYLQRMVDELNRDGLRSSHRNSRPTHRMGKKQFTLVTDIRNKLLCHRIYGIGSCTLRYGTLRI